MWINSNNDTQQLRRLNVLANHLNIATTTDHNNIQLYPSSSLDHHGWLAMNETAALGKGMLSATPIQGGSFNTNSLNSSTPLTLTDSETEQLANTIIRGDYRELRQTLFTYFQQHADYYKIFSGYDMSLDDARQKSHDRAIRILKEKFVSPYDILKDPLKISVFMNSIPTDASTLVKLSVHFNLFGACIAHLGTSEQLERWLGPKSDFSERLGCFLMSELTHASNVRKLGVTATYDRARNEFVLYTPDEGAQKYWIGNAYKSATKGVLFAQCIVDGVNHGVHAFVVPMRDPSTMKVYDGILVRDVGIKMGLNGIDNGMVAFNNYRIPIDHLLSRYAQIKDGKYETSIKNDNVRFAKHIGALLQARLGVGTGCCNALQMSLTTAIRYAHRRVQFGPPPPKDKTKSKNEEEWPLIKYKTHQMRLMPLVAEAYAYHFFASFCMKKYEEYMIGGNRDDLLKTVHLLASASKVQISWRNLAIIQECREACGGQGYLTRNLLPILRVDSEANVTLDGDNHLLLYQISGVLLSEYAKQFAPSKDKSLLTTVLGPGLNAANALYILGKEKINDLWRDGLLKHYANTNEEHLLSKEFLLGALQFRENRLVHTLAAKMHKTSQKFKIEQHMSNGEAQFAAHNLCSTHSLQCGKAYCDKIIAKIFFEKVEYLKTTLGSHSNIYKAMHTLSCIFAMSIIINDPFFLEKKVIGATKSKALKRLREQLVSNVTHCCLSLVDGFGIPDFVLEGSIGSRNENYVALNGYNHKIVDV
ncbi:hypothetical protein C9374_011616 [Naegleria lovaniensis]|uniref:Acyl-coenzyme A oxidase n=1 Tax=Naegleria lovaniensis TaxID=51637 RepID=A0AA88GH09_NAELO|nr:uncharacterized protein C9374_011616 [Naegleria lovaniensis]KAG2373951.1 hypothetical protein C9374_011616 [Naegleria lovaniensis]